MKFEYVSPKNVRQLVPGWIVDPRRFAASLDVALNRFFEEHPDHRPQSWCSRLSFSVSVTRLEEGWSFEVCPAPAQGKSRGLIVVDSDAASLVFPINAVLKGSDGLEGQHCVYSHTILTEAPLSYVGITSRTWFKRFSEHRASAARGSKLVFHTALATHAGVKTQHRVLLSGVNFHTAMHFEEEFVENVSLYPLGLNMIPGGFAGAKYLARFGIEARTAEARDKGLERLAAAATLKGEPNPLSAARWASDQDYVNRVICGHSGRLTVEQVRDIRRLASFQLPARRIAQIAACTERQAKEVSENKTYRRVG